MMRNYILFCSGVTALFVLVGCQTASFNQNSSLDMAHIRLMTCVDRAASANRNSGISVRSSVNQAVQACDREVDSYLSSVVARTMRKNGWDSVEPVVRTELKNAIITRTSSYFGNNLR